jgi:hypothetical protein
MLDSSKPLTQAILLAEVDGTVGAALSLSTGAGVADPFQRTGLVELLRVRACQLALLCTAGWRGPTLRTLRRRYGSREQAWATLGPVPEGE